MIRLQRFVFQFALCDCTTALGIEASIERELNGQTSLCCKLLLMPDLSIYKLVRNSRVFRSVELWYGVGFHPIASRIARTIVCTGYSIRMQTDSFPLEKW